MASRDLRDLKDAVADAARDHVERCARNGIDLLIYCTLRDTEEQAKLYRRGRTAEQIQRKADSLKDNGFGNLSRLLDGKGPEPGRKVTNAGPGESYHQYGLAYDCVPLVDGKAVWKTSGAEGALWADVGKHGKGAGLEWAGDWTRFREFPHFQLTGGRDIDDLMQAHFGQPGPTVLGVGDLATEDSGDSESVVFKRELADETTKWFVIVSLEGETDANLKRLHQRATTAKNLNPNRRVFWLREPDALDPDVKRMLWGNGPKRPAVVLSTGEMLARRSRGFAMSEVSHFTQVLTAFAVTP